MYYVYDWTPMKGSIAVIRAPLMVMIFWCLSLDKSWISFKIAFSPFVSFAAFLITTTGQNGTIAENTSDLLLLERTFFTWKSLWLRVVAIFIRSVRIYDGIWYCDFSAWALKLSAIVDNVEVDWKEAVFKSMKSFPGLFAFISYN